MIRFFSYTRRLVVAAYSSHLLNVPLFFFHLYIIWEDLGIPIFSIVFAQILSPPFPCLCHRASLDEPLMSGICVPTNALQCWNILRCHSMSLFFFVVSFLFRSPALVQQVQICWCPQWLEEANFSACKIHLCRERLFHHRILDNQNIARLVNSRVNLGDFAKNHKALYCSYRTSNPSQSVGYHYARRVKTPQALSQGWIKSEEAQRVGQAPYCHH